MFAEPKTSWDSQRQIDIEYGATTDASASAHVGRAQQSSSTWVTRRQLRAYAETSYITKSETREPLEP
jgi:hypothetical protein